MPMTHRWVTVWLDRPTLECSLKETVTRFSQLAARRTLASPAGSLKVCAVLEQIEANKNKNKGRKSHGTDSRMHL